MNRRGQTTIDELWSAILGESIVNRARSERFVTCGGDPACVRRRNCRNLLVHMAANYGHNQPVDTT